VLDAFRQISGGKYLTAESFALTPRGQKSFGVRAVITAEDFLKSDTIHQGPAVLKSGKVRSYRMSSRCRATDPDVAEEALHLIEVEYEALRVFLILWRH